MVAVTESRDSGVEILDTEVEETEEDAEVEHFRIDDPAQIQIGESAGNDVFVEAEYFIAASIEGETDEVTQMMTGEEYIDEASVFISNEDGEVGGGFIKIEEGDLEDAISTFEEDYL